MTQSQQQAVPQSSGQTAAASCNGTVWEVHVEVVFREPQTAMDGDEDPGM